MKNSKNGLFPFFSPRYSDGWCSPGYDYLQRYQRAGEVKDELGSIEKGIPTTGREIPRRKPITSKEITVTVGLKKLLVPALIFIAVVIIGVLIWQLLPEKGAVPSESVKLSIAILPFDDLSPEKDQEYFCDGLKTDASGSQSLTWLPCKSRTAKRKIAS